MSEHVKNKNENLQPYSLPIHDEFQVWLPYSYSYVVVQQETKNKDAFHTFILILPLVHHTPEGMKPRRVWWAHLAFLPETT